MRHRIRERKGMFEVIAPDGTIVCKKYCKLDAENAARIEDKRLQRRGKQ